MLKAWRPKPIDDDAKYNYKMKQCTKCKVEKQLTEFSKRSSNKEKYQSWCKQCSYNHVNGTYKTNPHRKEKLKAWTKSYQEKAEQFVHDYLLKNPCCQCGQTNILTLQFDHLRDKKFEIGLAVTQGHSVKTIEKEIAKCQVLCANCHSIKTATQLGNWKLKWLAR